MRKSEATGDWTSWLPWVDGPTITAASLAETLDGGQAFRWNWLGSHFEGIWSRYHIRLKPASGDRLSYSLPTSADATGVLSALGAYFALPTDFEMMTDHLPWRSDPVLAAAIKNFPGLRILRQPVGETLFCFLCSSTKQVPQIKAICEAVATRSGSACGNGTYTLPTWPQIEAAGETTLRACKLGYRAGYIHRTAQVLAAEPDFFTRLETLETDAAREQLMGLPGVGRKIADCVLLFGLGRHEAFPIDTWVQRILERAYGLAGWPSTQLQQFARAHFGPGAGYAQQYLFAAARAGKIPA